MPSSDTKSPRYFDYTSAAAYTCLSDRTLRRLVRTGRLPAKQLGRRIIFREQDLQALIEQAPAGRAN